MKRFNDFTDFTDGNWNGWQNGRGLPGGQLKTDKEEKGPNTFWTGKLETDPGHPTGVQASLWKEFTFESEEDRKAHYIITFDYRVQKPESGEAPWIMLTITTERRRNLLNYSIIEPNTEPGKWHHSLPYIGEFFYSGDNQIWIGTRGWSEPTAHRKLDIDNIRVVRAELRYE